MGPVLSSPLGGEPSEPQPTPAVGGDQPNGQGGVPQLPVLPSVPPPSGSSPGGSSPSSPGVGTGGRGGSRGLINSQCGDGRPYWLQVPASYREDLPIPILIAFHGAGDDYLNFANTLSYLGWRGVAESQGFLLWIPAHTNSSRKSFARFTTDGRADYQGMRQEFEGVLSCLAQHLGRNYNVDKTHVYLFGYSEGASFTALMMNDFSASIRAVAIFAGSAPKIRSVTRKVGFLAVVGNGDYNYAPIIDSYRTWSDHPFDQKVFPTGHSLVSLQSFLSASQTWQILRSLPVPSVAVSP